MTFGEQIKKRRKELKLTQTDFANRLQISQGLVSKIESDSIDPRTQVFLRILKVLELSLKEFKYGN